MTTKGKFHPQQVNKEILLLLPLEIVETRHVAPGSRLLFRLLKTARMPFKTFLAKGPKKIEQTQPSHFAVIKSAFLTVVISNLEPS